MTLTTARISRTTSISDGRGILLRIARLKNPVLQDSGRSSNLQARHGEENECLGAGRGRSERGAEAGRSSSAYRSPREDSEAPGFARASEDQEDQSGAKRAYPSVDVRAGVATTGPRTLSQANHRSTLACSVKVGPVPMRSRRKGLRTPRRSAGWASWERALAQ